MWQCCRIAVIYETNACCLFANKSSSRSPVSCTGQTLAYLADDIELIGECGRQNLHSASDRTCFISRTHNTFGNRSFSVNGPRVWNSLPLDLQLETQFSDNSKQYCFVCRDHSTLWLFVTGSPFKCFTYLPKCESSVWAEVDVMFRGAWWRAGGIGPTSFGVVSCQRCWWLREHIRQS